ncbi:dehydrase and lipid transport-domain-containing protein [Fomitopsis serialis]|uniref:dehydrase and lipid transport-domain-containing protein n=1 Tax=Fomitopsis serialis TaxID=139415 RepID=UPI002007B3C9|nr:dehydrase and lipid transport-domain-containing protein [Neoantrodia serialis]KAH9938047.1 dehydrase and lipid transport-domain-containing protein [Neoantrodia serialis]
MLPLAHLLLRPSSLSHAARRPFFTLPDLSNLSPFSQPSGSEPEPQTYHERKILPYKQSQLYNVVTDVDSYPHFLPFCISARALRRVPASDDKPLTMQAEMTVGFLSFKESYISDVTCLPNRSVEIAASSSTPLFRTLNTVWRFQPASSDSPHPSSRPPLSGPSSSAIASHNSQDAAEDKGPTLVTLDLAFSFANPVHAAVSAAFFGQVSKMMVKAFEERCLIVYGPGEQ